MEPLSEAEFNRLLVDALPRLRALSHKPGRIAREEPADLIQTVAVRAITHRDSFQRDTSFEAWLRTIMWSQALNAVRREAERKVYGR